MGESAGLIDHAGAADGAWERAAGFSAEEDVFCDGEVAGEVEFLVDHGDAGG